MVETTGAPKMASCLASRVSARSITSSWLWVRRRRALDDLTALWVGGCGHWTYWCCPSTARGPV